MRLLPHSLDAATWQNTFQTFDQQLVAATRSYVGSRSLHVDDIAAGFSELSLLRAGQEPDYCSAGLPVAYAFRYLPQRVACILAGLTRLVGATLPKRVLDIGSGSGATAIAFSLMAPELGVEIHAIEPSPAMREFAQQFPLDGNVFLHQSAGTLEQIIAGDVAIHPRGYDLVMMSACLPYGQEVIRGLLGWPQWAIPSFARLIAIEPQAKLTELYALEQANARQELRDRGILLPRSSRGPAAPANPQPYYRAPSGVPSPDRRER